MPAFLTRAIENAQTAAESPAHNLKIGDKVWVKGEGYEGETGTIVKFDANMLGLPIIAVKIDGSERAHIPSFYPHEVCKLPS